MIAAVAALEQLFAEQRIALLTLHGSVVNRLSQAHDLDLAYLFEFGVDGDDVDVASAFINRYGDCVDLVPLVRAGAVARYGALMLGELLVERVPHLYANQQIAAFGLYCGEEPLRRALLKELAYGAATV